MKYLALCVGVLALWPIYVVFRSYPSMRKYVWVALGVLPFLSIVLPFLDVALISWGDFWTGYVPGLQVTAIDIIAVFLFFSVRKNPTFKSLHVLFGLNLAALTLSMLQADEPLATGFAVWQFVRVYFLAVLVAKACTDDVVAYQLLKGLSLGLAIQFIAVIWQKFGQGMVQPTGTFVHQNTLGLITHLVVFPNFALLLAGQRQIQSGASVAMGLVIAALIASRGALGFTGFGFSATYLLSFVRKWSKRKALLGLAGVFAVAGLVPIAMSSLATRFDAVPLLDEEYDERAAFNRTAIAILEANPLGIGANHYSYVGKNYGYSVRSGVAPIEGSLNNIVHNAYLLAAAETGYFGCFSFTLLMIFPIAVAFRYAWGVRGNPSGDLLLGLGVAMTTVCFHSLFEYIVVIKEVQYVMAIVVGMTFGLAKQRVMRRGHGMVSAGRPAAQPRAAGEAAYSRR